MRVAAVSWAIRPVQSLQEFLGHMEDLVAFAVRQGAELVVLPENIDLERTSYLKFDAPEQIPLVLAEDCPKVEEHIRQLAQTHQITLLAGTHLRNTPAGILNSAIIAEGSSLAYQDKNVLTQWELNEWKTQAGEGLKTFHNGQIGVLVCYDCEFPVAAHTLAAADCKLICVPAFTETIRGFHRVRWSCHARAVETQTFIVHASLVGSLGREPVPTTYGSSAILCPSVLPLPESGILAQTPENTEAVAIAEIDLSLVETARNSDDVRNWHDRNKGYWVIK